ncbi:MAG: hypothetical protein JSR18_01515 [Proteobacteria bacterium]|nr:hypothetical protein [Pseudomonadota bacterium]
MTSPSIAGVRAIASAIQGLDDRAFAALLVWFDRYAEVRWQAPEHAAALQVAEPPGAYQLAQRSP